MARHVTWAGFIGIFALFFATHSIPVRPGIKSRIVAQVGPHGFAVGYSILSLAMLALLIWAAGAVPYVELWPQLGWHRHAAHAGMLAVCLILAFSIGRPNPFSFGGARNDMFDPHAPASCGWSGTLCWRLWRFGRPFTCCPMAIFPTCFCSAFWVGLPWAVEG